MKLIGILIAYNPMDKEFDPLQSNILFAADGETYYLIAGSETRMALYESSLINLDAKKELVHVKLTGDVTPGADSMARFHLSAFERIDL